MHSTVEVTVIKIIELVWDNGHNAKKIQIVFIDVQFEKLHRLDTDKGIMH